MSQPQQEQKIPIGRPTDYRPESCERFIEMSSQGMGIIEIAAGLGVTRQTLYNYCERYPEFLDAYTRGKELCQAWWEMRGREGLDNREFNPGLWKLNMCNRFRDDWRDKQEVEHSGEVSHTLLKMIEEAQQ